MDPRTTELIYGTRKTKGTKKINETLAGSEFFSSNRCDPQSIFRWATLKRATRIFEVMYIREFKNSYLSFQCASDHLSSYRYWSFHLRAVQDSHHLNRFFFCRGYDLPVRVRRARLTSDADLIRMCPCHCHCQGLFLPKRLLVVSQKKLLLPEDGYVFLSKVFFFSKRDRFSFFLKRCFFFFFFWCFVFVFAKRGDFFFQNGFFFKK